MTKSQITKRVKFFQEKFGLQNWDILVTFKKKKDPKKLGHLGELASNSVESTYLASTINFLPDCLSVVQDDTIIHELLHCLSSELMGYCKANTKGSDGWLVYFEERMVSELTQILIRSKS